MGVCEVGRALERVERLCVTSGVAQDLRPASACLRGLAPALRRIENLHAAAERVDRGRHVTLECEPLADRPPRASLLRLVVDAEQLERLASTCDRLVAFAELRGDPRLLDAQSRCARARCIVSSVASSSAIALRTYSSARLARPSYSARRATDQYRRTRVYGSVPSVPRLSASVSTASARESSPRSESS